MAYDNIRFGETPARCICIGVGNYPYTGTATITVHLDRRDAQPIATIPISAENANSTVMANIEPTTDTHHVFLRFNYSIATRANAFQLTSIQFTTQTAEEAANGINQVKASQTQNGLYYDLSGRTLSQKPQKGLYIHHGNIYSAP